MTGTNGSKNGAKINSSISTLNSTLSYFPSLKCGTISNASPMLKNSNETQRSMMESTAIVFSHDYSPISNNVSMASIFHRKAASNPRNRGETEKARLGREKLNKHHNRKHTDYNLSLLKNRIKKLEYEEQKAQKKIIETQRRAEAFMQTRYKFDVDQSIKHETRYERELELQRRRERFRQERLDSYERKKQIRMNIITNNLKEGLGVKKVLQEGFRDRDYRQEEILKMKLQKIQEVKEGHKRHSYSKVEREEYRNMENRKRVDLTINHDEIKASANVNKMKQLEKQEQKIMERLKETLSNHQKTVKSFEDMILAKKQRSNTITY